MITVEELMLGRYQVMLSGDHLAIITEVAELSPYDRAEVMFALLTSVLRLDTNNILFKE